MPKRTMRILCVEDEQDHAEFLRLSLESVPDLSFEFTVRPDAHGLRERGERDHDFMFLDYRLGPDNGLEILRRLRDHGWIKPVIMLTAHGDEYIAADVTRAGADGYLIKSDITPERLALVMKAAKDRSIERDQMAELQTRIAKLEELSQNLAESNTAFALEARIDALTQVMNRRSWEEAVTTEHERSTRYGHTYAIMIADVDHFKKFNDAAGHQAGDECLRRVAHILRQTCRHTDSVGRYGGEEFVMLLPETQEKQAAILGERLATALREEAILHPGLEPGSVVTCSFGVATGPHPMSDHSWTEIVRAADAALYEAKAAGRDRVHVAS